MLRAIPLAALLAASAYAQVSVCAPCHADVAATFLQTGMGRSFSPARPESFPTQPYYHQPSDTYFEMKTRDTRVYQRRWQLDSHGQPANLEEKQVDFVLGSGNHSKTYLHLTSRGTLQQLPLGWYAENDGILAMNPGYDRPDYPGSTRAISYECMSCHNAYPKIPAASREEGAEARYLAPLPAGIDCQRCHTAGQDHVATSGKSPILNPARLSPNRELEICMQCHLETTSRLLPHSIQKHGRAPFSYIPGQPLADFSLAFDREPGKNQAVEVAGGAYRFRQSQCFLKSDGKLRCTTCHNPHDIPRGEQAIAGYNKICATCHAAATPSHAATATNCVSCHMPKTRTDDAVHIVITDHRIQRKPVTPDPTAPKSEIPETPATSYSGPVIPYYPTQSDPLYTAIAQVRDGSNRKQGLPNLASLIAQQKPALPGFWVDLAEAYRSAADLPKAIAAFNQALARAPQSLVIPLKLANALMDSARWPEAEAVLRKATLRSPSDPLAWGLLGWTLWQQEKPAEARSSLERALKIDPEIPEFHNYLGLILRKTRDFAASEREFRAAVRIIPGISEWRTNLASALALSGKPEEARHEFERAIALKPQDPAAHFEYARFLASLGEEPEAEKHARAAAESNPDLAGPHELWGALLLNRSDFEAAHRELTLAVKLAPDFIRAHFELGVVLYSRGDLPAALEHLNLAAARGDLNAQAFLKRLPK